MECRTDASEPGQLALFYGVRMSGCSVSTYVYTYVRMPVSRL